MLINVCIIEITYEIRDSRRLKHLPDLSRNPTGHRFLGSGLPTGLFAPSGFVSFSTLALVVIATLVSLEASCCIFSPSTLFALFTPSMIFVSSALVSLIFTRIIVELAVGESFEETMIVVDAGAGAFVAPDSSLATAVADAVVPDASEELRFVLAVVESADTLLLMLLLLLVVLGGLLVVGFDDGFMVKSL